MPRPIQPGDTLHTYADWQRLGYQVQRGSVSVARNEQGVAVFSAEQVRPHRPRAPGEYQQPQRRRREAAATPVRNTSIALEDIASTYGEMFSHGDPLAGSTSTYRFNMERGRFESYVQTPPLEVTLSVDPARDWTFSQQEQARARSWQQPRRPLSTPSQDVNTPPEGLRSTRYAYYVDHNGDFIPGPREPRKERRKLVEYVPEVGLSEGIARLKMVEASLRNKRKEK